MNCYELYNWVLWMEILILNRKYTLWGKTHYYWSYSQSKHKKKKSEENSILHDEKENKVLFCLIARQVSCSKLVVFGAIKTFLKDSVSWKSCGVLIGGGFSRMTQPSWWSESAGWHARLLWVRCGHQHFCGVTGDRTQHIPAQMLRGC